MTNGDSEGVRGTVFVNLSGSLFELGSEEVVARRFDTGPEYLEILLRLGGSEELVGVEGEGRPGVETVESLKVCDS